jgi:hypothetical protein
VGQDAAGQVLAELPLDVGGDEIAVRLAGPLVTFETSVTVTLYQSAESVLSRYFPLIL